MIPPLTILREDGAAWSFDAVPTSSWDRRARVTDHPLERGGSVSDHALELPARITTPAVVTETPLAGRTFGQPVGRARLDAADDFLAGCIGLRLDLQFPRVTVAPYALESFTHDRSIERGRRYRLTFKALHIPTASTVEVPASAPPASEQTGMPDENDLGEQAGEATGSSASEAAGGDSETAEAESDSSLLYELTYGDDAPEAT